MWHQHTTRDYPENTRNGIVLCESYTEAPSFFSDRKAGGSKFRDLLVRAFAIWGHPLYQDKIRASHFERSITHTHWLSVADHLGSSGASSIRHQNYIDHAEGIMSLLFDRKPKLLFLFGGTLMMAINDEAIRDIVEGALGKREHDPIQITHPTTQLDVSLQIFSHTQVIGLPYFSGAADISDEFLNYYRDTIGARITKWKRDDLTENNR